MVVSPVEVVPDVISEETYFNLLCFCRLMYYINSASPISYIKSSGDILNIHWNPRPTGHQPHPLQHHELQVPRRLQAARPPHVLPLQETGDARTEHLQQDVLQVRPALVCTCANGLRADTLTQTDKLSLKCATCSGNGIRNLICPDEPFLIKFN